MAIAYQNFFNIDFHKIFHAYCKVCMLLPLPPLESACNLKNVCPLPSQQFFSFRYLFVFQYCFHIVHTFFFVYPYNIFNKVGAKHFM